MSWFESVAQEAAHRDGTPETFSKQLACLTPKSFTLAELADAARKPMGEAYASKSPTAQITVHNQLRALLICLLCEDRIRTPLTSKDEDAVQELARNIIKCIAPAVTQEEGQNGNSDAPAASNEVVNETHKQLYRRCLHSSALGIPALEALLKRAAPLRLDDEVLVTLLVYADQARNWASPQIRAAAARLLEHQFTAGKPTKEECIIEVVLQGYLRPLFSKSKPASITASGGRAEYANSSASRGGGIPDDTALTKPWKYTDLRAIPALAWALRESDDQLIAKHWPLFIPVLLTLTDDSTTHFRRQGLLFLQAFLSKFPDKTLHDTGLAKVFEDAVFPTLAFLPSLTPESDSLQLLEPAYAVLLSLAKKQPPVGKDAVAGAAKNALLDRMLREGVFMAYFHAKDHVHIVQVLCHQTEIIVTEMGVHAVKHLKDLVPMLSSIMTDPFAPVAPATLSAAVRALQAVLANCWPRIPASPWQDEILNALVQCWLHLADHHTNHASGDGEKEATYAAIERHLITSAKALAAVLKTGTEQGQGSIDLASHVAPLVEKEPRLKRLFFPSE